MTGVYTGCRLPGRGRGLTCFEWLTCSHSIEGYGYSEGKSDTPTPSF